MHGVRGASPAQAPWSSVELLPRDCRGESSWTFTATAAAVPTPCSQVGAGRTWGATGCLALSLSPSIYLFLYCIYTRKKRVDVGRTIVVGKQSLSIFCPVANQILII